MRLLQAPAVRLKQYAAVLAVAKSAVQTSGEPRYDRFPSKAVVRLSNTVLARSAEAKCEIGTDTGDQICSIARSRPSLRVIEKPFPPTRRDAHSTNGLIAS